MSTSPSPWPRASDPGFVVAALVGREPTNLQMFGLFAVVLLACAILHAIGRVNRMLDEGRKGGLR